MCLLPLLLIQTEARSFLLVMCLSACLQHLKIFLCLSCPSQAVAQEGLQGHMGHLVVVLSQLAVSLPVAKELGLEVSAESPLYYPSSQEMAR